MPSNQTLVHSPYVPFDPEVQLYSPAFGHLSAWEYAGWRRESLSWKEGVYLHGGLNPASPYRLSGPGALSLLADACINDFGKFSEGASKHAVMCNAQGNVMSDGIVMRLGETEFVSFFLSPYIDYLVESGRYDVSGEGLSGKVFLFQVAGPKSLLLLEELTGESLRDIEFLWHRTARISTADGASVTVRILRMGVARALAYEVHGPFEMAEAIYQAIVDAGKGFGLEKLGLLAYGMNHTEGGFAQSFIHFLPAWSEDAAFMEHLGGRYSGAFEGLPGSAGPDGEARYANPVELGWGHMITFDHPFVGSDALRRVMAAPKRATVTLEWFKDDVLAIFAAQFKPHTKVQSMVWPADAIWDRNAMSLVAADEVMVGDERVGISSGRIFSHYYGAMLSLALLEIDHAALGTEVEVRWGNPGTDQRQIRATVSRFPYFDLPFNKDINVHLLPTTVKE
ncbi:hypothetical protein [Xanthomonas campestris]|uniref:hypothetical protein n=1 Tax=Xanthomonas campestris TaxID=339 RepID=UPI001E587B16|nr:hypothetical protein [Xanthomonas campestris]MCC5084158.1 hypothetical protein [Xanthomonas campestris]